ncbi:molybdate transport system substrate-binding protein [Shimia haliotis]|uniref:Molybdate transport system substrate-binding protein n=1 Tax=Shimia haliotis TaxID=1280847 RepID=A0A1I4FNU6_9RHOB|nr:molybdate transport system substrate-binding protein [Shimia haliotis]
MIRDVSPSIMDLRRKLRKWAAVALCIGPLGQPAQAEVTVFAAASLKNVLEEIGEAFEQTYGEPVVLSVAGSSVLARQIAYGAPADVFMPANSAWMDDVLKRGRIQEDTRRDIVGNGLVLVRPAGTGPKDQIPDLAASFSADENGKIAMALVDAVPAGIYGKTALQHLGVWDGLAPRVVQTDNVRAALALVALGEVPLGIVYASDALREHRVEVVVEFPAAFHPPILYPAAVVADAKSDRAGDFVMFLQSETAQAMFDKAGFAPVEVNP